MIILITQLLMTTEFRDYLKHAVGKMGIINESEVKH